MTPSIPIPSPWMTMSMTYRVSAALRAALSWFFLAALAAVFAIVAPSFLGTGFSYVTFAPLVACAVSVLALGTATMTFVSAGRIRYQLGEDEIQYEAGILSRTAVSLPYDRIQTVSITSGLVDRLLGINHVVCQSAADQSNITLPGLRTDQAEATRQAVAERSRLSRRGGNRDL
ncbi:PH domain-containing protein [Herbiconiux sp. CPCC 205763]|uniref:PH domain-containing protein n=1 Tax=Herbiconiux aconitum TaxID=2970913 RepID=A0ABT2GPD7_9MICO|nr:PH domain-containing protein [Herbiconiux aconitum]MCS5718091.1 PH domain-containing protein [Herbiconiux aconitum]